MVQFALVDVEAHSRLARVEQASRMWRTIAAQLRELSDSLRHELDCLQPQWKDATGIEFARQAAGRKAAIDELLMRIEEHQPWPALDDLARQLLLVRARITDVVERSAGASQQGAAAHLDELDRYFHAAAGAVLAAAGSDERSSAPTVHATSGPLADGCCSAPDVMGPMLAGGLGTNLTPPVAPDPGNGSSLPSGSVSIPGLVAVPPGSSAGGRYTGRDGASGTAAKPRSPAGETFDASAFDPRTTPGGSLPGANSPASIERVADPVPITGPPAAPEAPQPPERPTGAEPETNRASGGMIPPMMMPPMVPGAGRPATGTRSGATRFLDGERRTRTTTAMPGVPPWLRGRSALADPAGSGYRPVATSGTKNSTKEPAVQEALDHEVWQVANPGAASPLKPEAVEPEQPRRLRRPRF
jgi:hypothetical protein